MYSYIKGILTKRTDDIIVIENNDIGYEIKCPFSVSAGFGHEGEKVTVWLYQSVKEDDISLYGFSSPEQKDMFLLLIDNVKGVGPKVAQSICAQIEPDRLALAVMSGDVQALTGVKGLGKKGAERIVLELKDKLKTVSSASAKDTTVTSGIATDAVDALTVLGYKQADAAAAVNAAYEDGMDLQDLIRKALRSLAR
ncbi:MAG: Holliday junction branch migration protein RuvA [Clostridiales bacterium]|nr:Holliday junction branch migration protein RuvA [Clostridiales bacterium]